MRFTREWKDYELIDCSDGERLERWGDHILIRPDPQVIWKSEKSSRLWGKAEARYIRSKTGGGRWEVYKNLPPAWQVRYKDLSFNVKTMGFKHTGLFPEQAVNWDMTRGIIENSGRKKVNVLNLFAYTGGATAACLAQNASVVHVDASKGMTLWAKENIAASGFADRPCRWIVDDCVKFVQREIRRGSKYDIIILDPPSYGRGPKGEIWRLEDSLYGFVGFIKELISDEPLMVLLNSYTTGLSAGVMKYILEDIIVKEKGGGVSADEIGLPVSSTGGVLPCGACAVWLK